jgi:RsiW-degrading membrane proteinase PrsW (M82 family)
MIGYIIPGFETISELTKETTTIKEIRLIWVPVITYLLISFSILMVVRIFKKLKPYKEKGLIWCLVWGFVGGLIAWLILSLIACLILDFMECFIFDFIVTIIVGLIAGPIMGLIWGLVDELK